MSKVSSAILGQPQDLFVSTSKQQADLGALMTTGDGNFYRYALNGASALVTGNLLQSAAQIADHKQLSPTAAVSATIQSNTGTAASLTVFPNTYPQVTVTLGATAATANYYANGWLVVSKDSGSGGLEGPKYQIESHPAASASATLALSLGDGIFNDITTSALIDLVANPYSGVVANPTTATGIPVGVAVYPMTAAYYGWVQVAGIAQMLVEANGSADVAVGDTVIPSTTTAGSVKVATGSQLTTVVGRAIQTEVYSAVGTFSLVGMF